MAGRGPAPKGNAVRRNAAVGAKVIQIKPSSGTRELPDDLLPEDDTWHPATLRWWSRWSRSELAKDLPDVDWSELEATALLHHEFMKKRSFTLAGELRLRMQKFGATPEDRNRLRITVAQADEADDKRAHTTGAPARRRRGALKAAEESDTETG